MKINLRQEIAMWVLGLLWAGGAFVGIGIQAGSSGDIHDVLAVVAMSLVSLVPIGLIIFSLRDRK